MGQSRKLLRSSGPPWVRIPRLPPVRPRASMEIHEKPAEQGKRESRSMDARRRFRCVTLKWGWRVTRRSERCRRRHPASGCPMLPVSRSSSSITHPMGRPSRTSIGPAKCESHRGANQTAKSADRPAKRERAVATPGCVQRHLTSVVATTGVLLLVSLLLSSLLLSAFMFTRVRSAEDRAGNAHPVTDRRTARLPGRSFRPHR
jgi:hypothetical protein